MPKRTRHWQQSAGFFMAARLSTVRPRIPYATGPAITAVAPVSATRLRGSRWERMRQQTLAQDAGLCRVCTRFGRVSLAREVDHITPLWAGGTDADDNRQSLCIPCHAAKSAHEAAQRSSGGVLVPWSPDAPPASR